MRVAHRGTGLGLLGAGAVCVPCLRCLFSSDLRLTAARLCAIWLGGRMPCLIDGCAYRMSLSRLHAYLIIRSRIPLTGWMQLSTCELSLCGATRGLCFARF